MNAPDTAHKWKYAFWTGAGALVFLALLLVFGRGIPCEQRGIFVAFIALAVALAFGFFGRSAELSGALPGFLGGPQSLRLSLAGGIAVFGLVMFYGAPMFFGSKWDECSPEMRAGLIVTVRDSSSQRVIADSSVSLKIGSATYTRKTDQFGEAEFPPDLRWTNKQISALISASDYQSSSHDLNVSSSGRVTVSLTRSEKVANAESNARTGTGTSAESPGSKERTEESPVPGVTIDVNIFDIERVATWELMNRGPGPARIREVGYFVGGQRIQPSALPGKRLVPVLERIGLKYPWMYFNFIHSNFKLPAGSNLQLFWIPKSEFSDERLEKFKQGMSQLSMYVCFCNEEGDCEIAVQNDPPDAQCPVDLNLIDFVVP